MLTTSYKARAEEVGERVENKMASDLLPVVLATADFKLSVSSPQ